MVKRVPVETHVDPSILGESLTLPTSKRVVRNRFLKSALSEYSALWTPENDATNGLPSKNLPNLYEKWSAAGYGIVMTGNVMIDKNHLESPGNTIISADTVTLEKRQIWTAVAKAGKSHGGLLLAQLGHAGRQTSSYVNPTPFSSSNRRLTKNVGVRVFGQPIELSLEQIQTEVIDKFVYTAKFFYEVGFDGIQFHGAHGYLLAQFLSGTTNKRTDKYGGSAANRARIVVDVYNAIRAVIPAETGFVIGIKLNSVEFQNEGLQTDEAVVITETLDKAGFDFIELSGGTLEKAAFKHTRESTVKREAYFVHFAQQITPAVKNAVIYLTGGFRTVPAMVAAVKEGATQGIGLGRPSTQEFDLVNNLISGKVESTVAWSDKIDPTNFGTAVFVCSLQMAQAAQKSVAESTNINEGIIDLSDDDTGIGQSCASGPSGFFSGPGESSSRPDLPSLKAHKVDVTQIRGVNVVPMDVRDEAECLFDEVHIIDEYKPDQPNNYVDFMRSVNCDPQFGEEIDDSRLERLIQDEIISGQQEREERTPSPDLQRPAPSGGAIAANIMAKMGYTQGSGLGKHGQGISQALRVEKKAGQAGKIVSELDEVMLSVGMNPETFNRPITNVLLLRNVYTNDDLPENFEAELKPELDRYGVVRKIQLKRQTTAEDPMEQVRVFVDYGNKAAAVRAYASLNNRYFSERAIRVDFYPSERFSMGYFFDPI